VQVPPPRAPLGLLQPFPEEDTKSPSLPCCTDSALPPPDNPEYRARVARVLDFLSLEKHYGLMKNDALKSRLKRLNLTQTGQKKALVERLLAKSHPLSAEDRELLEETRSLDLDGADTGFKRAPIMRGIELVDVIIDLLHLKLRVGGKLLKLLLCGDVLPADRQDDVVAEMRRIGVTFAFRATTDTKEGDGKVAWTSLMGTAMSKVLTLFNVAAVVDGQRAAQIQLIWTTFWARFCDVLDWHKGDDVDALQAELIVWQERFLDLYGVNDITPYIHHFVVHLAEAVSRHGGLRRYACEAAEKLNNLHQQAFHRATGKSGGRPQTLSKLKDPEYACMIRTCVARLLIVCLSDSFVSGPSGTRS